MSIIPINSAPPQFPAFSWISAISRALADYMCALTNSRQSHLKLSIQRYYSPATLGLPQSGSLRGCTNSEMTTGNQLLNRCIALNDAIPSSTAAVLGHYETEWSSIKPGVDREAGLWPANREQQKRSTRSYLKFGILSTTFRLDFASWCVDYSKKTRSLCNRSPVVVKIGNRASVRFPTKPQWTEPLTNPQA